MSCGQIGKGYCSMCGGNPVARWRFLDCALNGFSGKKDGRREGLGGPSWVWFQVGVGRLVVCGWAGVRWFRLGGGVMWGRL